VHIHGPRKKFAANMRSAGTVFDAALYCGFCRLMSAFAEDRRRYFGAMHHRAWNLLRGCAGQIKKPSGQTLRPFLQFIA